MTNHIFPFFSVVSTPTKGTPDTPQRVQILRGPDGKIQVRGLLPGQQLIQMPDGKLHVLSTNQVQPGTPSTSKPQTTVVTPTKTTVIKPSTPTNKGANGAKVTQSPGKQMPVPQGNNTLLIRQQVVNSPVVQKVQPQNTVVVSGGQMFAGQQIVVQSGQQVMSTPTQVKLNFYWIIIGETVSNIIVFTLILNIISTAYILFTPIHIVSNIFKTRLLWKSTT